MVERYIDDVVTTLGIDNLQTWSYDEGFFYRAIIELYLLTNKDKYFNYVVKYYNEFIKALPLLQGQTSSYDLLFNACNLFTVYEYTEDLKYLEAIKDIYNVYLSLPRSSDNLFSTTDTLCLLDDNLKALFFAIRYANFTQDEKMWQDIKQILISLQKHFRNLKTGLYKLSNQEEVEIYWLGAQGLLALLLVDLLELHRDQDLEEMFLNLSFSLKMLMISNMWPYLLDDGDNSLLEVSGTLLLCYSYLKGSKLQLLSPQYFIKGIDIFHHIQNNYFPEDKEVIKLSGILSLEGKTCEERTKKATYLNAAMIDNDYIGVSPFILVYALLKRVQK